MYFSSNQHRDRFHRLIRVLILTLSILLLLRWAGVIDTVNRAIIDAHHRMHARLAPISYPASLLVVAVDDRTPGVLPRRDLATLLHKMRTARAVGLDYILEPGNPATDTRLADAVRDNGRVIVPFFQFNTLKPTSSETQEQTKQLANRLPSVADPDPTEWASLNLLTAQPPYPALLERSLAVGYADLNADSDNVYRQPILVRLTPDGKAAPHLTLAIAAIATETPMEKVIANAPYSLQIGDRRIPLQGRGSFLYRPTARRAGASRTMTVPTISFADALSDRISPDFFTDRIVLVGETRTGSSDIRATPLDNGLRGVELNAEILASLLQGQPLQYMPPFAEFICFVAVVLLPPLFYERLSLRTATLSAVLLLAGFLGLVEGLYWGANIVPDAAPVLFGWTAASLLAAQMRAAAEARQREHLSEQFAAYVAPEVVTELVRSNPEIIERPRREYMAILFTDLHNFTPYTETHSTEIVQRQLTEFLGEMTEAVFSKRGFLDKFIGDAVMVLFGPFRLKGNMSADAILCAMAMQARLARLNQRWEAEGLPPFQIGIGIHAGEALFGNMSSGRRKTLTAIGDSVNLASRIENTTREARVSLLVSASVMMEAAPSLAGQVAFEDKGLFKVKGRSEPVQLYSVTPLVPLESFLD